MTKRAPDRSVITLPGGERVVPHVLRCAIPRCQRRKYGYLTVERSHLGGGAFYNKRGELLADLRDQNFVCSEHGVTDGSAPFLYPDPPKKAGRA